MHLPAVVHALGRGRDRIPEVGAGLGVGIRQRADQAVGVDPAHDVLDRLVAVMAQHRGRHRAQVHGVAHGRARAAVARDSLDRHGRADMVLAHAAQFLGDQKPEETMLGEQPEVFAREQQLLVAHHRVVAHARLAEIDQLALQRPLRRCQQPLRVEVVAEAPERLGAPHLGVTHRRPLLVSAGDVAAFVGAEVYRFGPRRHKVGVTNSTLKRDHIRPVSCQLPASVRPAPLRPPPLRPS